MKMSLADALVVWFEVLFGCPKWSYFVRCFAVASRSHSFMQSVCGRDLIPLKLLDFLKK